MMDVLLLGNRIVTSKKIINQHDPTQPNTVDCSIKEGQVKE
jgi:hypothetical protein